jgi:hypothetical protein
MRGGLEDNIKGALRVAFVLLCMSESSMFVLHDNGLLFVMALFAQGASTREPVLDIYRALRIQSWSSYIV